MHLTDSGCPQSGGVEILDDGDTGNREIPDFRPPIRAANV